MLDIPYKPLPAATLNALIRKAQRGDLQARDTVLMQVMRLVIRMASDAARRIRNPDMRDELITVAVIGYGDTESGVLRAITKYDAKQGIKFSSYAAMWIRAALTDAIVASRGIVPRSTATRFARVLATSKNLESQLGRPPTPQEIANDYERRGLDVPSLGAVERALSVPLQLIYFDPYADEHGDGCHRRYTDPDTYARREADASAAVSEDDVIDAIDHEADLQRQAEALMSLTPTERRIIKAKHGIGGPERSYQEIATELGIHIRRVGQIAEEAMTKLYASMAA